MKNQKIASPKDAKIPVRVIVSDCGVVEREIFGDDTLKIITGKQKDFLQSTVPWSYKNYVTMNAEEMELLQPDLDVYEKAFLCSVQPYVGSQDNLLRKQIDNSYVDIIFRDLIKITGIGKTKLVSVIESLRLKDIVCIAKNSRNNQYYMNPWIFNKSLRINKVLASMFQNYRIRSMGCKRWKDLQK